MGGLLGKPTIEDKRDGDKHNYCYDRKNEEGGTRLMQAISSQGDGHHGRCQSQEPSYHIGNIGDFHRSKQSIGDLMRDLSDELCHKGE